MNDGCGCAARARGVMADAPAAANALDGERMIDLARTAGTRC